MTDQPFATVLGQLACEGAQLAHGRIFLEDDLAVAVGVDLQRIALADAHGPSDLLGDDHAAEVINTAYNAGCFHIWISSQNRNVLYKGDGSICTETANM